MTLGPNRVISGCVLSVNKDDPTTFNMASGTGIVNNCHITFDEQTGVNTMSTIQELIDSGEVVLGETKIAHTSFRDGQYFIPMGAYKTDCIRWMGTNENQGLDKGHVDGNDNWSLYQEPVEMEDRWLWVHKDGRLSCSYSTNAIEDWEKLGFSKRRFPKVQP